MSYTDFGFETKSFADPFIEPIVKALALPADQLKYVMCLLAAFPCALIHRLYLPNTFSRHLFSLGVGLFFCFFCFGSFGWFHPFILSTTVYLLLKFLPIQIAYKAAVLFSYVYLLGVHIRRAQNSGAGLDISGILMLMTIKTTSIAFNLKDGKSKPEKVRDEWKPFMISSLPSLLEYYGYMFSFFNLLVGPMSDFREYLEFTDRTAFKVTDGKIPNSTYASLQKFRDAIICIVINLVLSVQVPLSYVLTEEFANKPQLWKYGYCLFLLLATRCSYYFIWRLGEMAHTISGYGFNGLDKDGKPLWNRVDNVDILDIELAFAPRDVISHWNIRVARYMRLYVYLRIGKVGGRPPDWALYVTNFVAAFWHGLYAGYYASYITVSFYLDIARKVRKHIRSRFVKVDEKGKEEDIQPFKKIYDYLGLAATWLGITYVTMPFPLLFLNPTWGYYSNMQYSGHIALAVLFVIFTLLDMTGGKRKGVTKEIKPE